MRTENRSVAGEVWCGGGVTTDSHEGICWGCDCFIHYLSWCLHGGLLVKARAVYILTARFFFSVGKMDLKESNLITG